MDQNMQKKTTTDITFGKVTCTEPKTVRTQEIEKQAFSWDMVKNCLWDMFVDEDEFVVLTVADARYDIRYVQAAQTENGVIVQLGIEEEDHTRLVEKECSREECLDIFREFYHSSHVQKVEKYHPVEFFV